MIDISLLVWPAVAFAVTATVALALRTGILAGIGESPGPGPRIVRDGILRPSVLWCVALGLYAANEVALDASLPVRWYAWVGILLESFLLLSLTMALVSMTGRAVTRVGTWAGAEPGRHRARKVDGSPGTRRRGLAPAPLGRLWIALTSSRRSRGGCRRRLDGRLTLTS